MEFLKSLNDSEVILNLFKIHERSERISEVIIKAGKI